MSYRWFLIIITVGLCRPSAGLKATISAVDLLFRALRTLRNILPLFYTGCGSATCYKDLSEQNFQHSSIDTVYKAGQNQLKIYEVRARLDAFVQCTCTDGLLWIQETVYYIAKHNFIKTRTLAKGLLSFELNVALQVLAGSNGAGRTKAEPQGPLCILAPGRILCS